jgi:hypothetical protein
VKREEKLLWGKNIQESRGGKSSLEFKGINIRSPRPPPRALFRWSGGRRGGWGEGYEDDDKRKSSKIRFCCLARNRVCGNLHGACFSRFSLSSTFGFSSSLRTQLWSLFRQITQPLFSEITHSSGVFFARLWRLFPDEKKIAKKDSSLSKGGIT